MSAVEWFLALAWYWHFALFLALMVALVFGAFAVAWPFSVRDAPDADHRLDDERIGQILRATEPMPLERRHVRAGAK